jgi:DNA-binding CsgD family transcriptional regulator
MREVNISELINLRPVETPGLTEDLSLNGSLRLYEYILQGIDAVVFIHDVKRNKKIWSNGNYEKVLGYSDAEFAKFNYSEIQALVHHDDKNIMIESSEYFNTAHSESFSTFYRVRHKLGQYVPMFYHFTILQCDEEGFPLYILGAGFNFSGNLHSESRLKALISENHRTINQDRLKILTEREKQIIRHKADGLTCKEISRLLSISYYTAETHLKNIHHKLKIKSKTALFNFAVETGLKG